MALRYEKVGRHEMNDAKCSVVKTLFKNCQLLRVLITLHYMYNGQFVNDVH